MVKALQNIAFPLSFLYFTVVSRCSGMTVSPYTGLTFWRVCRDRPVFVALLVCCTIVLPFIAGTPPAPPAAHASNDRNNGKSLPTEHARHIRYADGWVGYGCHWDLRDSIFSVQGFIPTAKAYYAARTFRDFTFEVRMAKLAEGGAIGLLFRYNEKRDEGYEIHLWPHGGFAVAKFVGPSKKDFAAGPPSHFNKELNTWNTVKVVGRGKRFDVFINGFHVCTASDDSYGEGKLGLLMPGDARQKATFQIIKMSELVGE